MTLCAACGLPGHRYGRNEGMERFDPQACINGLLGRLEDAVAAARRVAEAPEWTICEVHNSRILDWSVCETAARMASRRQYPTACRMVRKLLVDPPKETA